MADGSDKAATGHRRKGSSKLFARQEEPAFSPAKLSRQTLNDQVYEGLREAIISGALPPGTVITIRELAESFGVSMMPVREALSRLIAEKVLIFRPNRSIAVPILTADRFRQITKTRLLLEGAAAREAVQFVSADDISEMERLNARIEKAGPAKPKSFLDLNRRFHFTLYRASGQEVLVGAIESLWMQSGPILNYFLRGTVTRDSALEVHHRELITSLKARDEEGTEAAVRADLLTASNYILPIIEQEQAALLRAVADHVAS